MSISEGLVVQMQMFFSKWITPPQPHRFVYQLTGGRIGSRLPSVKQPVLLLTARGRRSGKQHTTPLLVFEIDGTLAIAATNNGDDHQPEWYWNLQSNPDAEVQIGRTKRSVSARLAEGEERRRVWARMTELHPLFAGYQRRTDREIPVFILEPVP